MSKVEGETEIANDGQGTCGYAVWLSDWPPLRLCDFSGNRQLQAGWVMVTMVVDGYGLRVGEN